MTLRFVLLTAFVAFSSVNGFAAEASDASVNAEAVAADGTPAFENIEYFHGQGRYYSWQCTAESSHGSYQHYYGQPSFDRHQAQHNAINECQNHEQHACVLVDCQPSGY